MFWIYMGDTEFGSETTFDKAENIAWSLVEDAPIGIPVEITVKDDLGNIKAAIECDGYIITQKV